MNASLWSCVSVVFEVLRPFLRIAVMFINGDGCEVILIIIERTDYEFSAAIFTEF